MREARLLDEGKFDEWLALFTPEAWYWVPIEPDQADPLRDRFVINDDRRLLETRVRRLASPRMYSQEPRSRTSRIVANVTIEEAATNACTVRSKFMMIEYRREQQRLFAGTALHGLVRAAVRHHDRLETRRAGRLRRAARRHHHSILKSGKAPAARDARPQAPELLLSQSLYCTNWLV